MGLPVMNIVFATRAKKSADRSERGVVGMIVRDTVPQVNPLVIYREKDIPTDVSKETGEQIRLALKGNVYRPTKVVTYVIAADAEDYSEALEYFSIKKVNWLCCPTIVTDKQEKSVAAWVKEQRKARNKVKAVLPGVDADDEGIVNYANAEVQVGETTYTGEGFCSRIAGLIAGTPSRQGVTYAVLPDVTACEKMDKEALDTGIDAGKFLLFYDGEKVKAARAVNSLQTTSEEKAQYWKKIKVVETMDMIHDDLTMLAEDNYIGKYPNTYDNKCLLMSAINAYFTEIARAGLIEDFQADFDLEKIRDYIIEYKGVSKETAEAMKEAELRKQYTDEKVFMKAVVTIVDIMEDIELNIEV